MRNDAFILQCLSSPPPSCHIWMWLLSSAPLSAVRERESEAEAEEGGRETTEEEETTARSVASSSTHDQNQGEETGRTSPFHSRSRISSVLRPSVQPLFPSPLLTLPLVLCMMSSSLLENPVQAILYLRELTTIVQNQQSLIQTQRSRIEELDRRVDELIGENRHLRNIRVQQHYPYHHHHHHHPDQGCLPHHHHPQDPQVKAAAGSVPDHAAATAQIEAAPVVRPSPTQPMDPGDMQLVPADPSVVSPVESDPENGGSCQSCRSLVPMTPTTLCRSIALARKSE